MRTTFIAPLLFIFHFSFAQSDSVFQFPISTGWVNDFENILAEKQEAKLSRLISKFEKKTSNQIAVVTINSIEPYDNMKNFSVDLFNEWGIGQKDIDNGLLIVFSKNLREVRITTGYGTEKILLDTICKKVIDEKMLPEFKKGDYYTGILNGLKALIKKWEKPAPHSKKPAAVSF